MDKAIHWNFGRTLKIDHTTKWYMYKLESVLVNETQDSVGFHLIPVRRPDLVLIKRKGGLEELEIETIQTTEF